MANYICDGYVKDVYLEASTFPPGHSRAGQSDGLHDEFQGTMRVLPIDERDAIEAMWEKAQGSVAKNTVYRRMLAKVIKQWDVVYPKEHEKAGQPVPIEEGEMAHLAPTLWFKLVNIALGLRAGDLPPSATQDEKDGWEAEMQAWERRQNTNDGLLRAGEKNSR